MATAGSTVLMMKNLSAHFLPQMQWTSFTHLAAVVGRADVRIRELKARIRVGQEKASEEEVLNRMPQMPVGHAQSVLEKAGYSVRMSRKRQGRVIVSRDKLSASLVVLHGCVSQERVRRLLELAKNLGSEIVTD